MKSTPKNLQYDVIVVDPPWPMKKIVRACRPNQTEKLDYATMSIAEIKELQIPRNPKGAHLWLWTTHKFMPDAFEILKAWDARYICTFTWNKPGGFQPYGLPQYNSEFALYARIGSPQKFKCLREFKTSFSAPRGKHSEKPEMFYAMVRDKTNGKRLDMFNRRNIQGFQGHGHESPSSLSR